MWFVFLQLCFAENHRFTSDSGVLIICSSCARLVQRSCFRHPTSACSCDQTHNVHVAIFIHIQHRQKTELTVWRMAIVNKWSQFSNQWPCNYRSLISLLCLLSTWQALSYSYKQQQPLLKKLTGSFLIAFCLFCIINDAFPHCLSCLSCRYPLIPCKGLRQCLSIDDSASVNQVSVCTWTLLKNKCS